MVFQEELVNLARKIKESLYFNCLNELNRKAEGDESDQFFGSKRS